MRATVNGMVTVYLLKDLFGALFLPSVPGIIGMNDTQSCLDKTQQNVNKNQSMLNTKINICKERKIICEYFGLTF